VGVCVTSRPSELVGKEFVPKLYPTRAVSAVLPVKPEDGTRLEGSGMVWENGLFVYRTGRPLPLGIVDDAIRQVREERAQHILGKPS
jgi:hypothetical protein